MARPALVGAAVAGLTAYAWWATALRPFTWPALVAVEAGGVTAIALGARLGQAHRPGGERRGLVVWGVLVCLLAAWELAAYFQHPRADHPTLSSLIDPLLDWHPARAVAFLAWLAVAARLGRR